MGVMLVTSLEAEGWVDIGAEKILGGAGREVGGRIARRWWELRLRERMIRFKETRQEDMRKDVQWMGLGIT